MAALSRSIMVLALLLVATSCDARVNGLGPGTSNPDRTPPTVVSTVPLNEQTQVSRTSPITITFSEPMRTSSMIASTFTFIPSIAGTLSYSGNTATLTPSGQLEAGKVYTATVTTAAEDAAGNNLAASFTWSFTSDPGPVLAR